LDRSMRFTTSVKIDILCCTIGSVIAVVMARLGCGYWSLICQTISLPVVGTVAVWIAIPWSPGVPRWIPELRSMIRFGGTVTLNSLVVYVAYNAEKILLGRFWGAAPLGIYTRAYQLATLPVLQLIGAFYVVAFSVLSRMQNDSQRLQRSYLKSQSAILSLTIPIVISSALFAKEIVLVVLGPKWMEAAAVLRLLAPAVFVFALVNPFAWLLQATGHVQRSLNIALMIAPVVILGIVAGLHRGPSGVALGYSAAMVVLFIPIVAWATHGLGISARAYWNSVKPPLISGIIAAGAGWFAQSFLTLNPIPLLVLELVAFSTVYAGILLLVMGEKDFYIDLLRHLAPGREASAVEV